MTTEANRQHLRQMLDALINKDGDAAKNHFHNYLVNRSRAVLEMEEAGNNKAAGGDGVNDPKKAPGAKDVKATMDRPKETKKAGEAKAEPKQAKSSNKVVDTMDDAKEIAKKGEAKVDPKAAKGSEEVKNTMDRPEEIKK